MDRRIFFRNMSFVAGGLLLSDPIVNAFKNTDIKLISPSALTYPNYNLKEIYFSLAGSYLTVTTCIESKTGRLLLKTCRQGAIDTKDSKYSATDYYEIALTKSDREISFETTAYPWGLEIKSMDVSGRIVFIDTHTILIEAKGANIILIPLQPFGWNYFTSYQSYNALFYQEQCVHQIRSTSQEQVTIEKNSLGLDKNIPNIICAKGAEINTIVIKENRTESIWTDTIASADSMWNARKEEVNNWMLRMPEVDSDFVNGSQMAWFMLWNCQVEALGKITRPAILMSKNQTNKVWDWNNCFNALAVASADPILAWNQMLLFFDNQFENGMFPDAINDLDITTGFVKPPIYGWAIQKMIDIIGLELSKPYLQEIYPKLALNTYWWFSYRDQNKNGIPAYLHENNSECDNSTIFDQGYPTEGADLSAYLILQTEALANFAIILNKGSKEIDKWKSLSTKQLNLLLTKCVSNERFISPLEATGISQSNSSLQNYIPTILGKRLPKNSVKNIKDDLSPGGLFLTEYGLASESIKSSKYNSNGYWRGSISAPSTYLIFDGLTNAGETELAKEIAIRFCKMCQKDSVMWENYDATTGKGLYTPASTYTASVFILLSNWLYYMK